MHVLANFCIAILQPPNSVNISENEETFLYCTVIGEHINWWANNTPVQDFVALGFDDSSLPEVVNVSTNEQIGKLKIRGSKKINGTMITCHVIMYSGVEPTDAESKPALILVQGIAMYMQIILYF